MKKSSSLILGDVIFEGRATVSLTSVVIWMRDDKHLVNFRQSNTFQLIRKIIIKQEDSDRRKTKTRNLLRLVC